jgi:hypothetical protein
MMDITEMTVHNNIYCAPITVLEMVSVTELQVCVHATPISTALTVLYNILFAPTIAQIMEYVTE